MKPKPQKVSYLDFQKCTDWIEEKYDIDTRDYARSHLQFGEWCESKGEAVESLTP